MADVTTPAPHPTTWSQRALALLSGLLFALAHPAVWPGNADGILASLERPHWVLSLFCLVPVLWAVRHMRPWQAYRVSAWMFIPATCTLLYWLMIAMNVFGGIPLHYSAALMTLLGAVAWHFMGTAVGVGRWLEQRWKLPTAVAIPVAWCGMELWRAHMYFGGFPWGNMGSAVYNNLTLVQLGSLGGVYLILMVQCVWNVGLLEVLKWRAGERSFPSQVLGVGAALALVAVVYGQWRLGVVDAEAAAAPKVKIALLQGNIEQGIKNKDGQHKDFIVDRYATLQKEAVSNGADVVVWPEASFPVAVGKGEANLRGYPFPSLAVPGAGPDGSALAAVGIVGSTVVWRDPPERQDDSCQGKNRPPECLPKTFIHNSALVVSPEGNVLGRFDKNHLVPFGEYVPWPLGPIARAIVPLMGRQLPGTSHEPVTLPLKDVQPRVGTLICYEGIFPQHTRDYVNNGAELLINVTNDAWYGISSAAPQHLAFYALRAAEHGRAFARAANTGVSAGIDPAGRIITPTSLFETTSLQVTLPVMRSKTVYAFTGDILGWACAAVFLFALGGMTRDWYVGRKQRKAHAA